MWEIIQQWYNRYFARPEAFILLFGLILGSMVIFLFGGFIAPILASLVIAFLLDSLVEPLCRRLKMPRLLSVSIVFSLFIGIAIITLLVVLPLMWQQFVGILSNLPHMVTLFHQFIETLPELYPNWITQKNIDTIISYTSIDSHNARSFAQAAFNYSLSSLSGLANVMVYMILVPLVTLFFLKDKHKMLIWCQNFLPENHALLSEVWADMKVQLGGYVNGKFMEFALVWVLTYAVFWYFGLNYGFLLAFLVGLSVIIPYVGMVIVTIPIVFVGLWQWGLDSTFLYCMLAYFIVQALDGNVVVPLLFSSAVNLHPVAIVIAVMFFGKLWGFWGLFFAIPLATLVRTLINAWRHIGSRTAA